ncbi:MAG: CehA/McbA family metallohydrolase [Candidatus Hydrogenedentes bacterium]|nr:CehA/McbA family metallohydrolase [Candidatus Hydrogenedentota bacterium]
MRVVNPYVSAETPWRRGNLHAHSTNSDGDRSPQAVVDAYAALGYDFLMISDHDCLTDPDALDSREMTLLPGNEVTARGPHVLHVNASVRLEPRAEREDVLKAIDADGRFAIMAHPNWEEHYNHCPQASLESWNGYIGIEIYNGVVRRLYGSPLATDRWDRLLSMGRRVWGFAHDDSHCAQDDGIAWIEVQSLAMEREALLDALRRGAFYASTGVALESVHVDGPTVAIRTENAQRITAISDFGRQLAAVDGATIEYTISRDAAAKYVRFECWGPGDSMAWTQPFFVEKAQ